MDIEAPPFVIYYMVDALVYVCLVDVFGLPSSLS
jgi:hypothetical protein